MAETVLLKEIKQVLSRFNEYWDNETLLKNRVSENLRNYEPELITALLSNESIKKQFEITINGTSIFKIEEFIQMLTYKDFWEDSYTKFSNKIGLTANGKYLDYNSDVVLDFPFKDCILEGGMTKEEVGKKEVYYNKVIARDEVDTLLSPKVFTNTKKYTKVGEEAVSEIDDADNLIIKGNNLLALHSLKERYAGKVKCIYIDPPYNTGGDSFRYNDRYNHSSWLTFMRNRLEIARELLKKDGVLFISLDDKEAHYCKVLADEIFEKENFIADISHKARASVSNDKIISSSHNHLLMYAKKEREVFSKKHEYGIDNDLTGFKEFDERGHFKFVPVDGPGGAKKGNPFYEFLGIEGYWRFSKETMQNMYEEGRVVKKGKTLSQKYYMEDAKKKRKTITTWWDDNFLTSSATAELSKLFGEKVFDNPKNENLLKRIIEFTTKETDIVLDFFMGSATTQAVAMKMNRQFIGIEQMDYINTVSVPRLQKVMEGEQGGISKDVNWQGGGSFIYTELMDLNNTYINQIKEANNSTELLDILETIKKYADLNYLVELEKLTNDPIVIDEDTKEKLSFEELTLDKQRELLIDVMDINQLYVNYSEIDDSMYQVSEQDKTFNRNFYEEGDN